MQILLAEEMRALDRAAEEEIGITGLVLMENAGGGVAEAAENCWAPAVIKKSSSLPAKATTAATAAAPDAGSTIGARR